jgi:hypothetical protein
VRLVENGQGSVLFPDRSLPYGMLGKTICTGNVKTNEKAKFMPKK